MNEKEIAALLPKADHLRKTAEPRNKEKPYEQIGPKMAGLFGTIHMRASLKGANIVGRPGR